ncbi:MAG: ROK family protein [Planctomycetales bacterium]|nr:ROK family protein [Planctomycetales bacterium]
MTVLACDLGGRRIKLGVVAEGRVVRQSTIAAHADAPLPERLPALVEAFRTLCEQHGITFSQCRAIVIGYPSVVDVEQARILDHFGKFGDAAAFDLRAWARHELGLPLALENDARLALIGEWQIGAGRGRDNVAMMTLGTGLGAAAVIRGQPLRGAHGQCGILGGHATVQIGGRPCVCGNVGCAEAEASTSVLPELLKSHPEFAHSPLAAHGREIGYEHVMSCAAAGDPAAQFAKDRSLQVWGAMAVNLIHAYDPELLILGGGVMGSRDVILPAISEYVNAHAHGAWGKVDVVESQLGDHAALLGSLWCAEGLDRNDD